MAKDYTFEEIENYLAGEMNADEKKAFESALEANQTLVAALKSQKESHGLVEMYARTAIQSKVKSIYDAKKSEESKRNSGFSVMKIAASLALLLVAGTLYFYFGSMYNPSYLANEAFEPYPNRFRTLGENDNSDFMKGLDAYDEQDYGQAIALLSKIEPENEKYIDAQFYLGVANLGSEQYQNALAPLKFVVTSESLYEGSANWYLCLVYLQLDQEENAKDILRSIAAKGGKKSKVAQELLDKLENKFRDFPLIE